MDLPQQVSVIIPVRNSSATISKCLSAVLSQSKKPLEIIVVDNHSTDDTTSKCRSYGITTILSAEGKVGAVRNVGARQASGKVLAFLDSDCVPSLSWLEHGERVVKESGGIAGHSYYLPDNPAWVERAWCSHDLRAGPVSYINGGNIFVSADLFRELNGFDEQLSSGEDAEFCFRARAKKKLKVISDPRIIVKHLGNPKSLKQFIKREIWLGLGAFGTAKHSAFDKPLIGTLIFLVCAVAIIVSGSLELLYGGWSFILLCSLGGMVLLCAGSAVYKMKRRFSVDTFWQLSLLYFCYYLARLTSLLFLASGRANYYHRN